MEEKNEISEADSSKPSEEIVEKKNFKKESKRKCSIPLLDYEERIKEEEAKKEVKEEMREEVKVEVKEEVKVEVKEKEKVKMMMPEVFEDESRKTSTSSQVIEQFNRLPRQPARYK